MVDCHLLTALFFHPRESDVKYCDERACLSVCLFSCIHASQKPHCWNLPNFYAYVNCGYCSFFIWRRCDTLCTSGMWMTTCFHTTGLWHIMRIHSVARGQHKSWIYCIDSLITTTFCSTTKTSKNSSSLHTKGEVCSQRLLCDVALDRENVNVLTHTAAVAVVVSPPGEVQSIVMSMSVCLSARITRKLHGQFSPVFVHVGHVSGSVLFWWRCALCTVYFWFCRWGYVFT